MYKYCSNCGNKVDENGSFCAICGFAINNNISNNSANQVVDNGGFGWALLGFFVPVVGLILYLTWKNEKPKSAKSAGVGALISTILGAVLCIFLMICFGIIFVTVL